MLTLPLLLAQCAGKQSPDRVRKELLEREAALAAADAQWEKKQAQASRAGAQNIPLQPWNSWGRWP